MSELGRESVSHHESGGVGAAALDQDGAGRPASAIDQDSSGAAVVGPSTAEVPVATWVVSPLDRPFGVARCLAGFAEMGTLPSLIPNFPLLPLRARQQVIERLGRAAVLPASPHAGKPTFGRVEDDGVLALLTEAATGMAPPSPTNLVSFEWVEIAPLIAGHLCTDSVPNPEQTPSGDDDLTTARFCLLSYPNEPFLSGLGDGELGFRSPDEHEIAPLGLQVQNGIVTVRYGMRPRVKPIRVWVVDGVAIAVAGLGRLVWLLQRGARRALCAVSYGYGTDALAHMPTVPETLSRAARPPLMQDFLDESLSVSTPVRERETTTIFGVRTVGPAQR